MVAPPRVVASAPGGGEKRPAEVREREGRDGIGDPELDRRVVVEIERRRADGDTLPRVDMGLLDATQAAQA